MKDNIFLGELAIAVPPRKAEEVELRVRFTYDINGLLEADVHIPLTGEHHRLVIEHNPGVLAPDEIAARLLALAALKVHPREQQVNTRSWPGSIACTRKAWVRPARTWPSWDAPSSRPWKARTLRASIRCAPRSSGSWTPLRVCCEWGDELLGGAGAGAAG